MSILTMDPALACELTLSSLGHSLEPLGKHCFRQSKLGIWIGTILMGQPQKKWGWMHRRVQGIVWLYTHHQSHEVAQLNIKRTSQPMILPWGKWECVSECRLPQLCGMLPRRPIYLSPHLDYWVMRCVKRGRECTGRGWENGSQYSWRE